MIKLWIEKIVARFKDKVGIVQRQWQDHGVNVDYDNAIWFFGCSHVFGTGLEHYQTAPYILEQLTGHRVINCGRPGIGPMTIEHQVKKLVNRNKPKAIVVAWPSFDRWQSNELGLVDPVLWNPHCLEGAHLHNNKYGSKALWPDSWDTYKDLVLSNSLKDVNTESVNNVHRIIGATPYIEFSYTQNEAGFETPCYPFADFATDNCHPGVATQRVVATWIKDELQLLL